MPEILLEDVVKDEYYVINCVRGRRSERMLLDSRGLGCGTNFKVVQNARFFPLYIESEGTKYAISRDMAKLIYVCPVDECDDDYQNPGYCEQCHQERKRQRHGQKD